MSGSKNRRIKKLNVFNLSVICIFSALVLYAFKLQVFNHSIYTDEANSNAIKKVKLPAPRGIILDRSGVILASNIIQNSLYIIPYYFKDDISLICSNVKVDCERLISAVNKYPFKRIFVAFIDPSLVKQFSHIPGLIIIKTAKREYNTETYTSHIIGYLGKIDRNKLEEDNYDNLYADDDYVGKTGIEYVYDRQLHGTNGAEQYVVMANGLELLSPNRFLPANKNTIKPVMGNDLFLSIDDRIQLILAKEMQSKVGAAVMLDINTGQVLAMYSNPEYDPNNIKYSLTDTRFPMLNRTLLSAAPGSTFKIIVALAALEMGIIMPQQKIHCPGYFWFGGRKFKCWKHEGHGDVNLSEAIRSSCDVYFYTLGLKVGLKNINKYAKLLGLGEYTGIDLTGESKGNIPTKKIFAGDVINVSIGQGAVSISPLQLARAYGVIFNGGKLFIPKIKQQPLPTMLNTNTFKPENIELLKNALYDVVNNERGTAYYSCGINSKVKFIGKSGTAQNGLNKKDNAWFAALYPADKPRIAIVVFVDGGGHGGSVSCPIARDAIEKYAEFYK